MLDDEIMRKVLKKALSNGGEYADVFVERRRSNVVQLEDNRIEKVTSGSVSGIGLRLVYDGKTAYAYTNDFSEKILLDLASEVSRAASGGKQDVVIDMKVRSPQVSFEIKVPPEAVPMSFRVELVKRGNEAAYGYDPRIRQVKVVCRDAVQDVRIFTSDGFIASDRRVYTLGLVQVVASDGDVIQTGYETAGGLVGYELFELYPADEIALKAAQRAVMMLNAQRAPGGRMPVIISSEAGGTMIHEAIGHGLEADLAQQGLSVYSGKIGERVASPAITVIDDATLPNRRGSFVFDDEGTPAGRNVLVKDGVLAGYMYDRVTAMKDGVTSTGNGRRESYESKPIPRMTNTFIAAGNLSPDEVLRSVSRGLLVKKMGGGQVNTVTGDFVFEVQEGYVIEGGEAGGPVRGATLIGNGPGVLKSIDLVASDIGFSIGTCGKDSQGVPVSDAMPTLRIPEIVVGGEVTS